MTRLSPWLALASAAGLALALWVLGRAGLGAVVGIVARIGVGGFLAFVAAQGLVLIALGAAWAWAIPGAVPDMGPIRLFAWGRLVREAANELLPFSQLGGLVLGLRVVLARGLPAPAVYAATVIDSVTEIASQIAYVLAGLAVLWLAVAHADAAGVATAAWAGLALLAALVVAVVALQRPLLRLAARAADRFAPGAAALIGAVEAELAAAARRPGALLASFGANLAAWLLGAGASWLALHLLGEPLSYPRVVALEALISVVRSGAFLIPGAIGAQEAGYLAIAPLLGLPGQAALALSLIKRARELAIGVPALLAWQASEARRR